MSNMIVSSTNTFSFNSMQLTGILDEDGNPWFIGKEVAEILGYQDTKQAIRKHCKKSITIRSVSGTPLKINNNGMVIIPESDLYRLVMRSSKPEAEAFQDWVVEKVLPELRQNGIYSVKPMTRKEMILAMLEIEEAKEEAERQAQLLQARIDESALFKKSEILENHEYISKQNIQEEFAPYLNIVAISQILDHKGMPVVVDEYKRKLYINIPDLIRDNIEEVLIDCDLVLSKSQNSYQLTHEAFLNKTVRVKVNKIISDPDEMWENYIDFTQFI